MYKSSYFAAQCLVAFIFTSVSTQITYGKSPLELHAAEIDFNRDIRPILAAKCFACHGPDEEHREADLRLDELSDAIDLEIIVPGKPEESTILDFVLADDPEDRMPPPDSSETLSDEQQELLRQWIIQGAKHDQHWSFKKLVRPSIPEVKDKAWPKNEIDFFVLSRLESMALSPSERADRYTLVRRIYIDLIGIPPTPEEADLFVNSDDPKAYQSLVEQLLSSQQYGERWARRWLDLARYSDTNGYEKDRPRSIWPYRDWVIRAINDDMPYDQFTVEQLAGDMLESATQDQKIATGFHRNTMLNEEGGIDPLEYRFYSMVDRVATTGTIWMGLTTGCAQCHSHKYDPITHTDYYRLLAIMNNADEPDLIIPNDQKERRRREIQAKIDAKQAEIIRSFPVKEGMEPTEKNSAITFNQQFESWLASEQANQVKWRSMRPKSLNSNSPKLEALKDNSIFSSGDITKRDVFTLSFDLNQFPQELITALRIEVLPDDRLPARGPGRAFYEGRKGDFFLSDVSATHDNQKLAFSGASHSFGKISIGSGSADAKNVLDGDGSTGWSTSGREGEAHELVLNLEPPISNRGELEVQLLFERHFAASLGRFRISVTSETKKVAANPTPAEIRELVLLSVAQQSKDSQSKLQRHFLSVATGIEEARKPIEQLKRQLPANITTMVMQERPADNLRKSFRHHRGEYLSPREEVQGGIPEVFSNERVEAPKNRLEFSRWLVSEENPMVGRVTVNRAWEAFFGQGIVTSNGDFGTQSPPPTHPMLLDWMASEFSSAGWSRKHLHRLIVNSATYQQRSHISPQQQASDPHNKWLSRGPRHRVEAEMVRDIMLKSSSLLSNKMYGPSVYPPQPASVTGLAYGNTKWNSSVGEERYRRSIYTFSKRTAPFAAYLVFDAPTGENCLAQRDRSNTPLQALTLLNDEMFLEMAHAMAVNVCQPSAETGDTPLAQRADQKTLASQRAKRLFRQLLTRPPSPRELETLLNFQAMQYNRLKSGELEAKKILEFRQSTQKVSASPEELASWMMLARTLMNLDEVITKE